VQLLLAHSRPKVVVAFAATPHPCALYQYEHFAISYNLVHCILLGVERYSEKCVEFRVTATSLDRVPVAGADGR
jgi:hypothetical protein